MVYIMLSQNFEKLGKSSEVLNGVLYMFFCKFLTKELFLFLKILKPSEKKAKYQYGGLNSGRPVTPPRTANPPKKR